jgi:hypothetical protein
MMVYDLQEPGIRSRIFRTSRIILSLFSSSRRDRFPIKFPRNMKSSIGNTGSCHVPQNGLRLLPLASFHPLLHNENRIFSSTQHQLPLLQGPPLSQAEHRMQLLSLINAALAMMASLDED